MNRKTFFQKLLWSSGFFLGLPALISGSPRAKKGSFQEAKWDGYEPQISKSPWGQKVFYDQYTYSDLQKALWRLEGNSWDEIAILAEDLQQKFESGELSKRKGPVKLAENLWLIDTDGQQNIYLLRSDAGLILVDPGYDSTTSIVIEQLKMLGFKEGDVGYVLLTHCHVDHAQSAAWWQKKGAEILIHESGVNPIKTGNEITAWWLMDREEERNFPAVREVTSFFDGDVLVFGQHRIFVCHSPGHTPDSCCFYLQLENKHVLISGDTIFHNGKHGWMGHPYSDYEIYLKSLWKLKNFAVEGRVHNEQDRIMVRTPIQFDMLLPGHTAISMDQVSRDLDKGIEIMSYTIQQRKKGIDYQWTEPYTFFAEREVKKEGPISIEYR
ncbi:MAG: MBL fold metallo-hydrolase [Bacteroides sp.]|nr:MBL fold metallo-hydrolase [Bacteroides sp.]